MFLYLHYQIKMVSWPSGLGSGLQNHVQRFESARDLSKKAQDVLSWAFLFYILFKLLIMELTLSTSTGPLEYIGTNAKGETIALSGNGNAVGPMESVLLAGAGCSAIDVELILGKMRQKLDKIEVKVKGTRAEDKIPRVFTDIHLHYILHGKIKLEKAESAVDKSVTKYCSVLTMLQSAVNITFSFEIITE